MKERLVTLGLALGALALFYALFLPKPVRTDSAPALPVSTESRPDGYQALWLWLQSAGVRTVSFRDHYDRLAAQAGADTGNLLIITMPQQLPARPGEMQALDQWLKRGNTLLVMAALDDTPAWALLTNGDLLAALQRMTGLKFAAIKEPGAGKAGVASVSGSLAAALRPLIETQRSSIVARGAHPLFNGVRAVAAESTYPAARWSGQAMDAAAVLEPGQRGDPAPDNAAGEPAVWLKRSGAGQILVLGFASPFSNALIGTQDNARLFGNIVAWSLKAHGAVLFDDAHQGLVSYYDAKAFFADPRLHRTLWWILGLWLLFVLGWQRLRPQADGWNPVDVTGFIKVTGGFLAGKVEPNLVAQRLCMNFFNRIRRRLGLPPDGLPVWEWLGGQAGVAGRDLLQLRRMYARAQTRRRIDLVQLQNCLARISGNLA